jgi:hypothetical protein
VEKVEERGHGHDRAARPDEAEDRTDGQTDQKCLKDDQENVTSIRR